MECGALWPGDRGLLPTGAPYPAAFQPVSPRLVKILISNGTDVNLRNGSGKDRWVPRRCRNARRPCAPALPRAGCSRGGGGEVTGCRALRAQGRGTACRATPVPCRPVSTARPQTPVRRGDRTSHVGFYSQQTYSLHSLDREIPFEY